MRFLYTNALWFWVLAVPFVGSLTIPPVFADDADLEISGPDQSVDEYAEEWRRARKLMRACGVSDELMSFLAFSEGMLVANKSREASSRGEEVLEDTRDYSIGHQDWFLPTQAKCNRVGKDLDPIMNALSENFDCWRIKNSGEEQDPPIECPALPLYRAPRFK